MFKINCIAIDDDKAFMSVLVSLIEQVEFLNLSGTYSDPIEGFNAISDDKPELVFLDVEMPNMTGIELLETLKDPPQIILITSKTDYAVTAFSFDVTDYLVKPLAKPRFLQAINKAKENFRKNNLTLSDNDNFFIKVDSQLVHISLKSILYAEAFGDYVKFHTPDNKVHTVYSTLKQVEALLPSADFVRVHRSFIVRIDKIENIEQHNLQIGSKIIPISYQQRKVLMSKIRSI